MHRLLSLLLLLLLLAVGTARAGFNFDAIFGKLGQAKVFKTESRKQEQSSLQQVSSNVQRHSSSKEWNSGSRLGAGGALHKFNFAKSNEEQSGSSHEAVTGAESGSSLARKVALVKDRHGRVIADTDSGSASSFNNTGSSSNSQQSSSKESAQTARSVKVKAKSRPCYAELKTTVVFVIHASSSTKQLYQSVSMVESFLRLMQHSHTRVAVVFFNSRVVAALDSGGDASLQTLRSGLGQLTYELRDRLSHEFNLASGIVAACELLQRHLGGHGGGGERAALVAVAAADTPLTVHEARSAANAADYAQKKFFSDFSALLTAGGELRGFMGEEEEFSVSRDPHAHVRSHRRSLSAEQLLQQITHNTVLRLGAQAVHQLAERLCKVRPTSKRLVSKHVADSDVFLGLRPLKHFS